MSEIRDVTKEYEARLAAATTDEERKTIIQEAMHDERMDQGDGPGIPIETIEKTAQLITKCVQIAFAEILAVAKQMNANMVPVEYIEWAMTQEPSGVRALYATIEQYDIPITMDVPDDISSLEGI